MEKKSLKKKIVLGSMFLGIIIILLITIIYFKVIVPREEVKRDEVYKVNDKLGLCKFKVEDATQEISENLKVKKGVALEAFLPPEDYEEVLGIFREEFGRGNREVRINNVTNKDGIINITYDLKGPGEGYISDVLYYEGGEIWW